MPDDAPRSHWLPAAAVAGAGFAWLAFRSQAYAQATLGDLAVAASLAFAASVWVFERGRRGAHVPLGGVVAASALFHLVGVLGFPVLEDDYFRYLWDGFTFANLGSPYGIAPSAFFDRDVGPTFEAVLDGINHPQLPTIYGPVCQWAFRLSYAIEPGAVWPLQLLMGGASLATVALLAGWARPHVLALFAWSPLLLKESAFTAHPDALGAFFLVAACRARERSAAAAGLLLALSTGTKPFALLLVPLVLRRSLRGWLAFVSGLVALYAPFVVWTAGLDVGASSLGAMGSDWLFNAPLHLVLEAFLPPAAARGLLTAALAAYVGVLAIRALRSDEPATPRGDRIFGVMLICAPALNPWYLAWLLPFAVLRPSPWAWVASFTVLLSYAHGLDLAVPGLAPYEVPTWALVLEFAPIALAIGLEATGRYPRRRSE